MSGFNESMIPVGRVRLIDFPDAVALRHNPESGTVSLHCADLSGGNMPAISGKYLFLPLNNLVYLGVNCVNGIFVGQQCPRCPQPRDKRANHSG